MSLSLVVFVHQLHSIGPCTESEGGGGGVVCCPDNPGGKAKLFAQRVNGLSEMSGE